MTKVFVSYSRKDLEFTKTLNDAIKKIGFESWVDWDDIPPTADWWEQIQKGIEDADAFIFLISPDSVKSDVCGREIDYALKNGKRIIPIVAREVNSGEMHSALLKLNWIFFREQDNFNESLKKLEAGVLTDLSWVEAHRRLQVRALEWNKRSDTSLLLRGKDLREAEEQLSVTNQKDPQPTDAQRQYVLASRKGEVRTRNGILIIGAVVMVALVFLAIFANKQRITANQQRAIAVQSQSLAEAAQIEAQHQAQKALAGSLAAQADSVKENDHALSLLLGVEAYQREDNLLTRNELFQLIQFSPYTRLFGFSGQISSVAVSPNGKWMAVASSNQVSIIDSKTHQIQLIENAELGLVNSLAFNADGSLLAAGGCHPDGCELSAQIVIWDMTDPTAPRQLSDLRGDHTQRVKTVAFSPNGKILASGSYDGAIILWNISQPDKIRAFGNPLKAQSFNGFVTSLSFSPDGNTLVSAGDDGSINLWDISTPQAGVEIATAPSQHTNLIYSIVFGPLESHKFASASDDKTIILWDWDEKTAALTNPLKLEGHEGFVRSIAFNSDGTVLASAGFDGSIILWNTKTGERMGPVLSGHTGVINTVAFGAAEMQNILISGSSDRTVILWDLSTRRTLNQPVNEIPAPTDIGHTAKSRGVEATAEGQQIKLTGKAEPLTAHTGDINSLNFSPQSVNGRFLLASASNDQTVILWDVNDAGEWSVFLKLDGFSSPVISAFFSSDGKQLTAIESNGHTSLWAVDPGDWSLVACAAAGRNLSANEWTEYFAGQEYRKTCESNP